MDLFYVPINPVYSSNILKILIQFFNRYIHHLTANESQGEKILIILPRQTNVRRITV